MTTSRAQTHTRLLVAVGILDILFGLWVFSGDPTGSWWLAAGAIGFGLVFLAAANRSAARPYQWSIASLHRLGLTRVSLVAMLGLCFLVRLAVRLMGR